MVSPSPPIGTRGGFQDWALARSGKLAASGCLALVAWRLPQRQLVESGPSASVALGQAVARAPGSRAFQVWALRVGLVAAAASGDAPTLAMQRVMMAWTAVTSVPVIHCQVSAPVTGSKRARAMV